MSPPFAAERLVERDALGEGIDLYERKRGRLYRCRFCHLGFSPVASAAVKDKARAHVATHAGAAAGKLTRSSLEVEGGD